MKNKLSNYFSFKNLQMHLMFKKKGCMMKIIQNFQLMHFPTYLQGCSIYLPTKFKTHQCLIIIIVNYLYIWICALVRVPQNGGIGS